MTTMFNVCESKLKMSSVNKLPLQVKTLPSHKVTAITETYHNQRRPFNYLYLGYGYSDKPETEM